MLLVLCRHISGFMILDIVYLGMLIWIQQMFLLKQGFYNIVEIGT